MRSEIGMLLQFDVAAGGTEYRAKYGTDLKKQGSGCWNNGTRLGHGLQTELVMSERLKQTLDSWNECWDCWNRMDF